jgi:hypothetical protein
VIERDTEQGGLLLDREAGYDALQGRAESAGDTGEAGRGAGAEQRFRGNASLTPFFCYIVIA